MVGEPMSSRQEAKEKIGDRAGKVKERRPSD